MYIIFYRFCHMHGLFSKAYDIYSFDNSRISINVISTWNIKPVPEAVP